MLICDKADSRHWARCWPGGMLPIASNWPSIFTLIFCQSSSVSLENRSRDTLLDYWQLGLYYMMFCTSDLFKSSTIESKIIPKVTSLCLVISISLWIRRSLDASARRMDARLLESYPNGYAKLTVSACYIC